MTAFSIGRFDLQHLSGVRWICVPKGRCRVFVRCGFSALQGDGAKKEGAETTGEISTNRVIDKRNGPFSHF